MAASYFVDLYDWKWLMTTHDKLERLLMLLPPSIHVLLGKHQQLRFFEWRPGEIVLSLPHWRSSFVPLCRRQQGIGRDCVFLGRQYHRTRVFFTLNLCLGWPCDVLYDSLKSYFLKGTWPIHKNSPMRRFCECPHGLHYTRQFFAYITRQCGYRFYSHRL